ncbi:MAG: DUF5615 family PIN-like protein [Spirochaetes bacterium]|nr:DUF5615 family PIN-like protein [Spirochaetota bacterium]
MKPFAFPLIADQNIHPDVILYLKQNNFEIFSIYDSELRGKTDNEIIEFAKKNRKARPYSRQRFWQTFHVREENIHWNNLSSTRAHTS